MTSKAVLKDVARVLGIDHNLITDLNKRIPVDNGNVMPLEDAIVEVPEIVEANKKYPELFELAIDLQSMPRNTGVHSCFTADTKVRTKDGLKRIVHIEAGEEVLTHKGRYRTVQHTHELLADELYTLEVESHMDTRVTGDHPYWTAQLEDIELGIMKNGEPVTTLGFTQPVWKRVEDLVPGIDYVMMPKRPGQEMKSIDSWPQEYKDQQTVYQVKGEIWFQVKDIKKESLEIPVYTLTVEDDNSYTANGLAVQNCGIQVAPVPLDINVPLMTATDRETGERIVVTQYEGGTLEDLGYPKFDILGLKTLTMIDVALKEIKRRHGVEIDIDELEPEDEEVFKMIHSGNTTALFQIESEGMTQIFTGLEEVNFESLIAGIALYRPGPMAFVEEYIDRANGLKPVRYPVPELEEILEETYGIAIYQEQIMKISQVLAGYSAGQSDSLRKATGKKSQKVMDEEMPKLKKGIVENGYSEELADGIIAMIEPFVGYSFNKSHSAA